MSIKNARESFKEMINLCYEEDFPELHKEIYSLEIETKKKKNTYNKYEDAMKELLDIIPIFSDDFPQDVFLEIEKIFEDFIEENE